VATDRNVLLPSGPGVVGQADEYELSRGGRPPAPAGTGARFSAQEIATTLTGAPLPTRAAPQRAAGGFCLSFCLIHSRPGPFTDVHPDRVCGVRGRWRTSV